MEHFSDQLVPPMAVTKAEVTVKRRSTSNQSRDYPSDMKNSMIESLQNEYLHIQSELEQQRYLIEQQAKFLMLQKQENTTMLLKNQMKELEDDLNSRSSKRHVTQ